MTAPRRKSAKLDAPQTKEEATDLLAAYLEDSIILEEHRGATDAAIAAVEAGRDRACAPLEERMKERFLQLRTWFTANRLDLTDGKRKSIELAGALIGERTTPPSLKLEKGLKLEELVAKLIKAGWGDLVRVKHSADKPAILKFLGGEHGREVAALGCSAHQADEFFIDRARPKDADPEVVAAPDAPVREASK